MINHGKGIEAGSICLLGAGNVATHLGAALREAGYIIKGVYSRTAAHAQLLAGQLACPVATDRVEALPDAAIALISVKDDAVPAIAASWAESHPESQALLMHTAGSVPLEAVSQAAQRAAVLYPLQTFSRARAVNMHTVPFFVEGSDAEALREVSALAHRLSASVTPLPSANRRLLHLAAVFACNFSNHCYALAFDLLRQAGAGTQCLLPLIDETAAKVHGLDPQAAQTGPAVRWDESVMQRHLALLAAQPELQALYTMFSQSIHRHSQANLHS